MYISCNSVAGCVSHCFYQSTQLRQNSSRERLERVMKSPNYRNGGYDTHYAEIGNRFPNIDLAILENGQYDKEWSLIHLMPQYMAQTARDLKARES